MLKVTDLLLQSNGFGMIALDLGDVPVSSARRIPLASWFRFRRAVEHTPTALLVLEQQPIAGSCSSVLVEGVRGSKLSAVSSQLLRKSFRCIRSCRTELLDQFESLSSCCARGWKGSWRRSRCNRQARFNSRAAWAG
jgi:hypothetical protein